MCQVTDDSQTTDRPRYGIGGIVWAARAIPPKNSTNYSLNQGRR